MGGVAWWMMERETGDFDETPNLEHSEEEDVW